MEWSNFHRLEIYIFHVKRLKLWYILRVPILTEEKNQGLLSSFTETLRTF